MRFNQKQFGYVARLVAEDIEQRKQIALAQRTSNDPQTMQLETKDRVDISLKEYETLKKRLSEVEIENAKAHELLRALGMEFEKCQGVSLSDVVESINPEYTEIYRSDDARFISTDFVIKIRCDGLNKRRF